MTNTTTTQEVYVPQNGISRANYRVYHTDPECQHLQSSRAVDLERLDDRFRECRTCAGEVSQPATNHRPSLRSLLNGPTVWINPDRDLADPQIYHTTLDCKYVSRERYHRARKDRLADDYRQCKSAACQREAADD